MSFRASSKEAKKSRHNQHKLGAVIVKGGRVLSTGYNQMRPSSLLETDTLHAEGAAILKLLKDKRLHDLSGADIYVSRFTRGGAVGLAKPCAACHALIQSVGIRRVFFTDSDGTKSYKV